MGAEKRRSERLDSNLFVDFESLADDSLGRGVVTNVSISGFGVETEADLQIDTVYNCHIEIPMTIKAKLVRATRPGQRKQYGFQFVGQGFFDKFLLKKLLKGRRSTKKV